MSKGKSNALSVRVVFIVKSNVNVAQFKLILVFSDGLLNAKERVCTS